MNKRWLLVLKILLLAAVLAVLGWKLASAWHEVSAARVDWRFSPVAVLGFMGSMITSALVWRWLVRRMTGAGEPLPTVPLLGAYTFSQMGKYIPGKVALLLMRIERSGRFGLDAATCTLSTLLENALYMISGGLTGIVAIARITTELEPKYRPLVWPVTLAALALLLAACHPAVFYGLVNRLLRKMKRPEVGAAQRLTMPVLALAVLAFIPCWLFGGVALWASASCMHQVGILDSGWFAGAFALSVIIGMASFLPAGIGIREAVLIAAVTIQFSAWMGHDQAFLLASIAAALQRLFQIVAEIVLGVVGAALTAHPPGPRPPM